MQLHTANFLFNHDLELSIEQFKEELIVFLEYPDDQLLLDLICSDLDNLEHQSIDLGLSDLYGVLKALHDHLYIINHRKNPLQAKDLERCIDDISSIEKVLTHYRLAG